MVIENIYEGEELRTDLEHLSQVLGTLGSENILCVLSTTRWACLPARHSRCSSEPSGDQPQPFLCCSCFAPRAPDRVEDIARLCAAAGVPHVINNAYGLQSSKICHSVNQVRRLPRRRRSVKALPAPPLLTHPFSHRPAEWGVLMPLFKAPTRTCWCR